MVPLGATCLRIVSCGNIGYAYVMVMMQAFNGAGDTITPTVVNFFGFWLLEIPLAYWLAILGMSSNGVFFSIAIARIVHGRGERDSIQAGEVEDLRKSELPA